MSTTERIAVAGFDEVHRLVCAGATAFVALHRCSTGPAFGGIRIRAYGSAREALDEALSLARAMSRKVAIAGLRGGGGKCVLVAPEPWRDRAASVRALGDFVESLGGRYLCGPDYGFGEEDVRALASRTGHVACFGLAEATARTVALAMEAAAPDARRVAVQGLGAVGLRLAERLRAAGKEVVASDLRPVDGFDLVPPEEILETECDVLAPCALGGVLDGESISRLRCRVVCGAANDQCASEDDEARLRDRGIVAVPDFVANCGALIAGASRALGEEDRVEERLAAIGPLVRSILDAARRDGRTPQAVARTWADRRIDGSSRARTRS